MELVLGLPTPGLSPTATEVAIITVASHFGAAYPMYAHEHQARDITNLTEEQIAALKTGTKPVGLDEQSDAAYEVARELVEKKGPMSKGRWDDAVRIFGMDGALSLINYVGFYSYICMVVNAVDTPVPEGVNWKW